MGFEGTLGIAISMAAFYSEMVLFIMFFCFFLWVMYKKTIWEWRY